MKNIKKLNKLRAFPWSWIDKLNIGKISVSQLHLDQNPSQVTHTYNRSYARGRDDSRPAETKKLARSFPQLKKQDGSGSVHIWSQLCGSQQWKEKVGGSWSKACPGQRFCLKNKLKQKKGSGHGSSGRALAYQGSEFKPYTAKKKKASYFVDINKLILMFTRKGKKIQNIQHNIKEQHRELIILTSRLTTILIV
jgi:hypothetical protein